MSTPTPLLPDAVLEAQDVASTSAVVAARTSSRARACRFCFDDAEPLIHPCKCRGSVALVHPDCLQRWHETNPNGVKTLKPLPFPSIDGLQVCELCRTEYRRERVGLRPWYQWRAPRPRNDDDPAAEADFQVVGGEGDSGRRWRCAGRPS